MGYIVKRFYTDDFPGFREVIPCHLLVQSKRHTFNIEQNNSKTRHWLARFRRRTLVVSKSTYMIEISVQLLAIFRFSYHFSSFTNMFHMQLLS